MFAETENSYVFQSVTESHDHTIISDNTPYNSRYISCPFLARMKNLQLRRDIAYVLRSLYSCMYLIQILSSHLQTFTQEELSLQKKFVHLFQASSNCFSCGAAAQRGQWPPHSRGFYITHDDAPQSVGLLWTSDRLVAETSTRSLEN